MAKFRRLEAPVLSSYVAPNGESWPFTNYEYINKDPSGGDRAPMDTNPLGSVANNIGSFFVAFQDDASSSFANRPHWALSMNTDILDDLLHRPVAITQERVATTSDGSANLTVSSGWVWAGDGVDDDPSDFVRITHRTVGMEDWAVTWDNAGVVTATKCIDIMQGGLSVLGSGFVDASLGAVTLVFSHAILINTAPIYLYYFTRSSLATMSAGNLGRYLLRPEQMTGDLLNALTLIRGDTDFPNVAPAINLAVTKVRLDSIESYFMLRGMDEAYRRKTGASYSAVPDLKYYAVRTNDIAGNGGWIRRDGVAPSVYSQRSIFSGYNDPIEACHKVFLQDSLLQGSSGYVAYGSRRSMNSIQEATYGQGYSTFLTLQQHRPGDTPWGLYTAVLYDSAANIDGSGHVTLLDGISHFWAEDGGGQQVSSVAVLCDLLEFRNNADGKVYTWIIQALDGGDSSRCTVVDLTGGTPGLSATGTVRLRPVVFRVSDGSASNVDPYGFFYSSGTYNPDPSDTGGSPSFMGKPAGFFGPPNTGTERPVLAWGCHANIATSAETPKYVAIGRLTSDGGAVASWVSVTGNGGVSQIYSSAENRFDGTTSIRSPSVTLINSVGGVTIDMRYTRMVSIEYPLPGGGVPGENPFAITLTNLVDGADMSIAIVRDNNDFQNISVTCTKLGGGAMTGVHLSSSDALLTPYEGSTVVDLYTVKVIHGRAYWSVQRF